MQVIQQQNAQLQIQSARLQNRNSQLEVLVSQLRRQRAEMQRSGQQLLKQMRDRLHQLQGHMGSFEDLLEEYDDPVKSEVCSLDEGSLSRPMEEQQTMVDRSVGPITMWEQSEQLSPVPAGDTINCSDASFNCASVIPKENLGLQDWMDHDDDDDTCAEDSRKSKAVPGAADGDHNYGQKQTGRTVSESETTNPQEHKRKIKKNDPSSQSAGTKKGKLVGSECVTAIIDVQPPTGKAGSKIIVRDLQECSLWEGNLSDLGNIDDLTGVIVPQETGIAAGKRSENPSLPEAGKKNVGNAKEVAAGASHTKPRRKKKTDINKLKGFIKEIPGDPGRIVCNECGMRCHSLSGLCTHVGRMHKPENMLYKCGLCPRKYWWKYTLQEHIRLKHTKTNLLHCSVCQKGFVRNSELTRHMKRHVNDEWFQCPLCPKQVKYKGYLFRHIRQHSEHKFYHCKPCGLSWSLPASYTNHMAQKHSDTKPQIHCPHCDKVFTTLGGLKFHSSLHTGEKPYKCALCHVSCRNKDLLSKHLKSKRHKRCESENAQQGAEDGDQ